MSAQHERMVPPWSREGGGRTGSGLVRAVDDDADARDGVNPRLTGVPIPSGDRAPWRLLRIIDRARSPGA